MVFKDWTLSPLQVPRRAHFTDDNRNRGLMLAWSWTAGGDTGQIRCEAARVSRTRTWRSAFYDCDRAILTGADSEHNSLVLKHSGFFLWFVYIYIFFFKARVDSLIPVWIFYLSLVLRHKPVITTRVFLSHMLYNKNVNTVPLITLTSHLLFIWRCSLDGVCAACLTSRCLFK